MIPEGAFDLTGVVVTVDTGRAIKVECDEIGEGWIPKSNIVEDPEADYDVEYTVGYEGRILVQSWFAEKRGWL